MSAKPPARADSGVPVAWGPGLNRGISSPSIPVARRALQNASTIHRGRARGRLLESDGLARLCRRPAHHRGDQAPGAQGGGAARLPPGPGDGGPRRASLGPPPGSDPDPRVDRAGRANPRPDHRRDRRSRRAARIPDRPVHDPDAGRHGAAAAVRSGWALRRLRPAQRPQPARARHHGRHVPADARCRVPGRRARLPPAGPDFFRVSGRRRTAPPAARGAGLGPGRPAPRRDLATRVRGEAWATKLRGDDRLGPVPEPRLRDRAERCRFLAVVDAGACKRRGISATAGSCRVPVRARETLSHPGSGPIKRRSVRRR